MKHIDEPTLLSALQRHMKVSKFMCTALLDDSITTWPHDSDAYAYDSFISALDIRINHI